MAGYLPATYFVLSPWVASAIGAVLLLALVFGLGRRTEPAG